MGELSLNRMVKNGMGGVIPCSKFYGYFAYKNQDYRSNNRILIDCANGSGSVNIMPYYMSAGDNDSPQVIDYSAGYASMDNTDWDNYPSVIDELNWSHTRSMVWTGLSSANSARVAGVLFIQGTDFDSSSRNVQSETKMMLLSFNDEDDAVDISTKVQFRDISSGAAIFEVGSGTLELTVTLKRGSGNVPYFKVDYKYSGPSTLSLGKNSSRYADTVAAYVKLGFYGWAFCGEE